MVIPMASTMNSLIPFFNLFVLFEKIHELTIINSNPDPVTELTIAIHGFRLTPVKKEKFLASKQPQIRRLFIFT